MAERIGNQRASSGSDITLSCSDGSSGSNSPRNGETKAGLGWPLAANRGSAADVERLKSELEVVSRKAENAELEVKTLRKQIVKETKRGQELCKEVEKLRVGKKPSYEGSLREELIDEKTLNANLRIQLQKMQDSNSELILAVQELEQMLEQQCKNREDDKEDDKEDEMQMEQLALDYEILKQENQAMSCKLEQSHLRQQLKLQYECSGSYATIHELENQVERLEGEIDECSNELSDSLMAVKELEIHCQRLEGELERQAQEFKALIGAKVDQEKQAENRIEVLERELEKQSKEFAYALDTIKELERQTVGVVGVECGGEAVARGKGEQEQRAIRAEEALRLTRWKNANMAGRLQDEFKRLEAQMQSTFEENAKVATKAMREAGHLRAMNYRLEELLKHAGEEVKSVKEVYEAQVSDLRKEMELKTGEMDQMLHQSAELLMLRAEVERLKSDTECLSAQIEQMEELREELEQAKKVMKEQESLLQRTEMERDNLESSVDSAKKEAEKSLEELNKAKMALKSLQSEKNQMLDQSAELLMVRDEVERLKSDTVSLSAQMEELREELEQAKKVMKEQESLLQRTEMERDNLEGSVDSARKETEKSLEELNKVMCLKDVSEMAIKNLQSDMENFRVQCEELRHSTIEGESEKKKLRKQVLKLNAELTKKDGILANMERKLKESTVRVIHTERTKGSSKNNKAEPPSRSSKESASFREKIQMLEEHIKQKEAAMDTSASAFLDRENYLNNKIKELERRLQDFKDDHRKGSDNAENGNKALANSNGEEASAINSNDEDKHNIDVLINEMASLRENNSSMETELKEMQERYSEISLKFAEVEGERQQLVMTLRNVKNATRN